MENTRNFKPVYSEDDEYRSERTLTGRLTRKRWAIIQRYIRTKPDRHPYGVSPNGYPYTCGCVHDCCGCLCSEQIDLTVSSHWKGHKITLTLTQTFNY